jgi:hypothetical protein
MRNKERWDLAWFSVAVLSLPVLMFVGVFAFD